MSSLDPVILFFLLGLLAGLLRAELRLPAAVYDLISTVLLLSIGLKGGVELAQHRQPGLFLQVLATVAMGCTLTLAAFPALRYLGRFKRADAASIAAHYGSVSVGTFAVAVAYLSNRGVTFEAHMPLLLAVLEIPAIAVGILLARGFRSDVRLGVLLHEVFLGKGIVLLLGGLAIGWLAGPAGVAPVKPLFFDLFKGVLALFLLETGLIAASQLGGLRRYGAFLVLFGLAMPLLGALLGSLLGWALELSPGGSTLLATMAASASYIAVPAAMRVSVPEANPALSLLASLGVTFPFNVLVGIPLYYALATAVQRLLGG